MITVAKAFDHFPALIDGVVRRVAKRGGVEAGPRCGKRGINPRGNGEDEADKQDADRYFHRIRQHLECIAGHEIAKWVP